VVVPRSCVKVQFLHHQMISPLIFFATRVARHCKRLPREAVAAPSLAVFMARLDRALSNLV